MIVFDLACEQAHAFEGWFRSSEDFADQLGRGMLVCPACGSDSVRKAPMAPAVPAKGNRAVMNLGDSTQITKGRVSQEVAKAFKALSAAQAKALASSEWVGDGFAEKVRSMHYGEAEEKQVHGRASKTDAIALLEEGIPVEPLLVPIAPPDEVN